MDLTSLTAISPIDGRYSERTKNLKQYFSEEALIKYRLLVEVEYFIALCNSSILQLNHFPAEKFSDLRKLYKNFSVKDAQRIKDIESNTNHDVKALEYFLKEAFDELGLQEFKEFIHFGLTSQDINNTAVPLSIKNTIEENYLPHLKEILKDLEGKAKEWKEVSMLARTHGQAASPTRLGKEIMVFVERIENQLTLLKSIPFSGKFGGAIGNFNAHHIAYPEIDWVNFTNNFTSSALGLQRQQTTTQIEHYDNLAALLDNLSRINTILIDFSRDIWAYVSMDYFKQKIKKGEIGSSAMPHKVNPIDFENAEGNLAMANAIFGFLTSKLPISRLQRDLTDSTVLRNIGVPFAHTIIAFTSLENGIDKLLLNKEAIDADLENNWAVIAEAIQTILRREGFANPYETLKELTRTNEKITKDSIADFISNLDVSGEVKKELLTITPFDYTGI
ncbi:MAG: adenylosuccinate lyase [Flavobacteriales bacterium]|jgi:adenylosuccinate lyase|nr:adenylosuccinate lyase [Flavobacteriales bacterium]MDP7430844.1 adenylosuccinate lyase [Flavobacteriales bacterium]HJN63612.1 adenylosuccinate lyase [Flavobacteriales bacterium]|tara:strand:+ start:5982 stop:7325 length:1344 start_codon:yes stop_codon:yes gene_type:complete